MTTKFDIGEEVYIKVKIVKIDIHSDGCDYTARIDDYDNKYVVLDEEQLIKISESREMKEAE